MVTPSGPADGAVFARLPRDPGEPVAPWLPPLGEPAEGEVLLRVVEPSDHGALTAEFLDPEAPRWLVGPPPADPDASGRDRAVGSRLGWLVGPSSLVAVVDRASGEVAGHL